MAGVVLEGMEQTWFITGSSRGLGRAIARAALDAGDLVATTARRPAQLDDLLAEFGESIHTIGLDVTDAQAARSAIADARHHFGRLNVIVNNAGCANVSPIETTDDKDSAPSSRPTSGASTTSPRRRSRSSESKGADSSCRSRLLAERARLTRDRLVPGRKVPDRPWTPHVSTWPAVARLVGVDLAGGADAAT